jgi:hypothetical protein
VQQELERRVATLGDAVTRAAAALNAPLEAHLLEGAARLLAELAESGALLGPTQRGGGTANRARSSSVPAFSPAEKEGP